MVDEISTHLLRFGREISEMKNPAYDFSGSLLSASEKVIEKAVLDCEPLKLLHDSLYHLAACCSSETSLLLTSFLKAHQDVAGLPSNTGLLPPLQVLRLSFKSWIEKKSWFRTPRNAITCDIRQDFQHWYVGNRHLLHSSCPNKRSLDKMFCKDRLQYESASVTSVSASRIVHDLTMEDDNHLHHLQVEATEGDASPLINVHQVQISGLRDSASAIQVTPPGGLQAIVQTHLEGSVTPQHQVSAYPAQALAQALATARSSCAVTSDTGPAPNAEAAAGLSGTPSSARQTSIAALIKSRKKSTSKAWKIAIQHMNPDLPAQTWFLGLCDTKYGHGLKQECSGEKCPLGSRNIGKSMPILYTPVIASFPKCVPAYNGQSMTSKDEEQLGCVFACSPSCAKLCVDPAGRPSNTHSLAEFSADEVKLDHRLEEALGKEEPCFGRNFKSTMLSGKDGWGDVLQKFPRLKEQLQQRTKRRRGKEVGQGEGCNDE
ncbi:hypothetical protein CEUSTIGMA_g289.t1 [Chlamydomonas eustigma]|uniref:Uncharacterized protein n=1 Tax=Chlamydomonas eustigma TaxID=1157962 RepID=A0A250WPR0_9CHLO|nr:hypothetical protein CEUSTIGMA_g289.t1 [Chlamydomonas eustigma]|eukprot:GAX72834.1 hypothetical protein CEUSTIGMA_g289.t1 [Chlamydomonas eustigma]